MPLRFEICESEKDIAANYDLVAEIYPKISRKEYEKEIAPKLVEYGHKQVVAYEGKKKLGLAGYTHGYRLYRGGEVIQVHNAIVKKGYKSKGVGRELFKWIEKLAKKSGCKMVIFDSYYDNEQAHKFFYREGYVIKAYTFMKDI